MYISRCAFREIYFDEFIARAIDHAKAAIIFSNILLRGNVSLIYKLVYYLFIYIVHSRVIVLKRERLYHFVLIQSAESARKCGLRSNRCSIAATRGNFTCAQFFDAVPPFDIRHRANLRGVASRVRIAASLTVIFSLFSCHDVAKCAFRNNIAD